MMGELVGYGVLRECHQGYKIGPLFADDEDVADSLFRCPLWPCSTGCAGLPGYT